MSAKTAKVPRKRFQVRSNRYPNPGAVASLQIKNVSYEILDYSATGIAVLVVPGVGKIPMSEEFEAEFIVNGFKVFPLKLHFIYQSPPDKGKTKMAFEVVGTLLDAEQVKAAIEATQTIQSLEERREIFRGLSPEYRNFILETVSELNALRERLKQLDANLATLPSSTRHSRQSGLLLTVSEHLRRRLRAFYIELEKYWQACHSNQRAIYRSYFQSQFKDFLCNDFPNQWNSTLPPSSQGTYGRVGLGLRGEWEGEDIFFKALGFYYTSLVGAEALQNRSAHLIYRINDLLSKRTKENGSVRILSVASGVNTELHNILSTQTEAKAGPMAVVVLDSEMNFLQQTQILTRELAQKNRTAGGTLHFEHWATKDYLDAFLNNEESFDLIYSTYLLDFLHVDDLMVYLPSLWNALSPGGHLILASIAKEFHSDFALELELNWNLMARNSPDLANLAMSIAGNPDGITIEADEQKTNLILVLEKPDEG
jgi:SAM-dependent methyltransferase